MMEEKELGIIPRLRWGITGIASVSLLASVFFAAKGGVFAQDWGQAVPIYIIGTMENFVEYILSEYLNGGNTGGAETAALFIVGVVYAFSQCWLGQNMLIAFLKIKISWK